MISRFGPCHVRFGALQMLPMNSLVRRDTARLLHIYVKLLASYHLLGMKKAQRRQWKRNKREVELFSAVAFPLRILNP